MSTLIPQGGTISPVPPPNPAPPVLTLSPEDYPSIEHLVIEDGAPVDSKLSAKQMRLLTEPLHANWPGPGKGRSFTVDANVGLFMAVNVPPLVPDVMLSVDVLPEGDLSKKEDRTYLVWLRGKVPDVVIEIVSNTEGGETDRKRATYALWGIPFYVIYDPLLSLRGEELQVFRLNGGVYERQAEARFPRVNLGLTLWEGTYEGNARKWLRWCDLQGQLILTGKESTEQAEQRAEQEQQRAEQEQQRAERLAEQLRRLGIEPEK